jgi:hypothetical protein
MVDKFNEEIDKIHSFIEGASLRSLWVHTNDYYCAASQRKKGLLGYLSNKSINEIPNDWVLRFGHIVARISWFGDDKNGTWALNTPRTMKCEYTSEGPPEIEWRLSDAGNSLDKAKELAENILINDLVLDYTIIVDALSFLSKTPGKFTRVSER